VLEFAMRRRRCLLVTVVAATLVVLAGGCAATGPTDSGLPGPAAGAGSTPATRSTAATRLEPAPTAGRTTPPTGTRPSGRPPAGAATAGPAGTPALPPYAYSVRGIDSVLAYRMRHSWRPGCPVPLSDLRYLRMTYYGFDGAAHTGEMVVHAEQATAVVRVASVCRDWGWEVA
jgi:hypothetical protein